MDPRLRALAVAALALMALAIGVAGARGQGVPPATGVVPAEGEWLGVTSAGLPVGFRLSGGQVTQLQFGTRWGECGTYQVKESETQPPPVLDPDGSLIYSGYQEELIEGTFVSPERIEGRVMMSQRELPACPRTEANFAAELGRVPTYVRPQVFAVRTRGGDDHRLEPSSLYLGHGLFFRDLTWKGFGESVTSAGGAAVLRLPRHDYAWFATVRLPHVVPRKGRYEVYATLAYTLRGPIKRGLPVRRHAVLNML
jgi:hypothetical protein